MTAMVLATPVTLRPSSRGPHPSRLPAAATRLARAPCNWACRGHHALMSPGHPPHRVACQAEVGIWEVQGPSEPAMSGRRNTTPDLTVGVSPWQRRTLAGFKSRCTTPAVVRDLLSASILLSVFGPRLSTFPGSFLAFSAKLPPSRTPFLKSCRPSSSPTVVNLSDVRCWPQHISNAPLLLLKRSPWAAVARLVRIIFTLSATRRCKPTLAALNITPSRRDRYLREARIALTVPDSAGDLAPLMTIRSPELRRRREVVSSAQRGYAMLHSPPSSGRSHTVPSGDGSVACSRRS